MLREHIDHLLFYHHRPFLHFYKIPSWQCRGTGKDNAQTSPCKTAVRVKLRKKTISCQTTPSDLIETHQHTTTPPLTITVLGIIRLSFLTDFRKFHSSAPPFKNSTVEIVFKVLSSALRPHRRGLHQTSPEY